MNIVKVNSSKPYSVYIERGIIENIGKYIKPNGNTKYLLLTDENVERIYGERIDKICKIAQIKIVKYVVPAGEESKSMSVLEELLTFMIENHFSRTDGLIAFGGGVVGDLGGFAAGVYQRGIDYIQIPTTLLAAVDSSVGGKTAVNLTAGKNLVGVFKQPIVVLCDPDLLETLPMDDFRSGVAEIIKYAILFDRELFNRLSSKLDAQSPDLSEVISKCVNHKAEIVRQDEFESGKRQLLNLGHTVGHAIEKASGYKMRHGYAVAIGIAVITRAGLAHGIIEESIADEVLELLDKNKLPIDTLYPIEELFEYCKGDKKSRGDSINVIMFRDIEKPVIIKINYDELYIILKQGVRS